MSADQWSTCPRCLATAEKNERDQRAKVAASYGKVSIEEFDKVRDAIEPVNEQDYTTFREDFEVYGAETGVVKVDYRGSCTSCGLSLSFTEERAIPQTTTKDAEQEYDSKGRPVINDD